mmetsp:Transcript_110610/g.277065  ORF Transcript_110610/g.277065 Transcript_110610/m.277065 type:complete len:160 (+) Transcript_110610:110-589(+)
MATGRMEQNGPMRSVTEYIRSPHQQAAATIEKNNQTKQQQAAKNHFRKTEAQAVADMFKQRVEKAIKEECEDWEVILYEGDLVRKALLKIRMSEADFVHLHLSRPVRGEAWVCRYAAWKGAEDELEQAEEEYEALPERSYCGDKMDFSGCTTIEGCKFM